MRLTARNAQNSPVSPLSKAEAHQGTEGLSPVSPLSENPSPSDPPRPKYTLRAPPPVPGSAQAEQELRNALNAASALPRSRYRDSSTRRRLTEAAEASNREQHINETLTLEEMDQDLFPSPLVVQKRWKRSPSPPRRPSLRYPAEELKGENAHWGNAQEVRVVHKGKGKIVNSRSNSRARSRANSQSREQLPPLPPLPMERSRPVVVEAPGPEVPKAEVGEDGDGGDGKERRDTTFAGAEVADKAKGDGKGEVEVEVKLE